MDFAKRIAQHRSIVPPHSQTGMKYGMFYCTELESGVVEDPGTEDESSHENTAARLNGNTRSYRYDRAIAADSRHLPLLRSDLGSINLL